MIGERTYSFEGPEGLLAHYTTAEVAFEHILSEQRLRMSPYRVMRDPAENKDLIPGTAFWGDQPNAEQGWAAAIATIKRVRDACRVLSLTRDADEQDAFGSCWARPRMWEQYADTHRGVALVFDRVHFLDVVRAELNQAGMNWLGEVSYTPAGIAESAMDTIIDDRIFHPEQRARALAEFIENNRDDFFFLKSSDFESEHEYRAVLMAGDDEYAYVGYRDSLVAVVIGERFPDWWIPGAREICDRAGVTLRRMHWERGHPFALRASARRDDE
jgi:hypothetical protein